jgi:hypothetical protein
MTGSLDDLERLQFLRSARENFQTILQLEQLKKNMHELQRNSQVDLFIMEYPALDFLSDYASKFDHIDYSVLRELALPKNQSIVVGSKTEVISFAQMHTSTSYDHFAPLLHTLYRNCVNAAYTKGNYNTIIDKKLIFDFFSKSLLAEHLEWKNFLIIHRRLATT